MPAVWLFQLFFGQSSGFIAAAPLFRFRVPVCSSGGCSAFEPRSCEMIKAAWTSPCSLQRLSALWCRMPACCAIRNTLTPAPPARAAPAFRLQRRRRPLVAGLSTHFSISTKSSEIAVFLQFPCFSHGVSNIVVFASCAELFWSGNSEHARRARPFLSAYYQSRSKRTDLKDASRISSPHSGVQAGSSGGAGAKATWKGEMRQALRSCDNCWVICRSRG